VFEEFESLKSLKGLKVSVFERVESIKQMWKQIFARYSYKRLAFSVMVNLKRE